jgi:uncharacterized membrane-anchored protein YitT (DUF2179 family)
MKKYLRNITLGVILEYILLMLGCVTIALSFNLFLLPNKIASGGFPGISIVLYKFLKINPAYLQLFMNSILLLIGTLKYGKSYGFKTILGILSIPSFIVATQSFIVPQCSILTASILGGAGIGIGLIFIYKSKSSAGGFSSIAQLLHDYTKIKISRLIMLLNAMGILIAAIGFGFSGASYAFAALLATGFSMDAFNFIEKKA